MIQTLSQTHQKLLTIMLRRSPHVMPGQSILPAAKAKGIVHVQFTFHPKKSRKSVSAKSSCVRRPAGEMLQKLRSLNLKPHHRQHLPSALRL